MPSSTLATILVVTIAAIATTATALPVFNGTLYWLNYRQQWMSLNPNNGDEATLSEPLKLGGGYWGGSGYDVKNKKFYYSDDMNNVIAEVNVTNGEILRRVPFQEDHDTQRIYEPRVDPTTPNQLIALVVQVNRYGKAWLKRLSLDSGVTTIITEIPNYNQHEPGSAAIDPTGRTYYVTVYPQESYEFQPYLLMINIDTGAYTYRFVNNHQFKPATWATPSSVVGSSGCYLGYERLTNSIVCRSTTGGSRVMVPKLEGDIRSVLFDSLSVADDRYVWVSVVDGKNEWTVRMYDMTANSGVALQTFELSEMAAVCLRYVPA